MTMEHVQGLGPLGSTEFEAPQKVGRSTQPSLEGIQDLIAKKKTAFKGDDETLKKLEKIEADVSKLLQLPDRDTFAQKNEQKLQSLMDHLNLLTPISINAKPPVKERLKNLLDLTFQATQLIATDLITTVVAHETIPTQPAMVEQSRFEDIKDLIKKKKDAFKDDKEALKKLEKIEADISKLSTHKEFVSANSQLVNALWLNLDQLSTEFLDLPTLNLVFQDIQMIATALVTKAVADKVIPAAHGKVKDIWIPGQRKTAEHVYSTPREGSGLIGKIQYAAHESELREELKTVSDIRETLKQKALLKLAEEYEETNSELAQSIINAGTNDTILGALVTKLDGQGRTSEARKIKALMGLGPADRHLAVDFEEVTSPEERLEGKFTLKSKKATGDLEGRLAQEKPLEDPLEMGEQLVDGMSDLQETQRAHGDLKAENIFLYGDQLKIADFGKAVTMQPDETRMYTGNPRYEPPEGRLSLQGEVYSTAIVLIRVLEKNYLSKKSPMLLEVDDSHRKAILPEERRLGVERYMLLHEDFPQTETTKMNGKFTVYGRRVLSSATTPSEQKLKTAEAALGFYIDVLIEKYKGSLEENLRKNGFTPEEASIIAAHATDPLKKLILDMTQSDPEKRPTMSEAREKYHTIRSTIELVRKSKP